jgi:predicted signal transduction protein with EAL and GGDEF domain
LRDADTAMYIAKTSGKARIAVVDSAIRARAVARLEIETDLRTALAASDGLVVHYQPQVNLRSGEIVGFEALVRWQHPRVRSDSTHRLYSDRRRNRINRPIGCVGP